MHPDVTGVFFKCELCDWLISANMIAAADAQSALDRHLKKKHKI